MIPRRFSASGGRWGTLLWARRTYQDEDLVSKVFGYVPSAAEAAAGSHPEFGSFHSFRAARMMNSNSSSAYGDPQSID